MLFSLMSWLVVDILEEMLYLCNCESLQINLLPQDSAGKYVTHVHSVTHCI